MISNPGGGVQFGDDTTCKITALMGELFIIYRYVYVQVKRSLKRLFCQMHALVSFDSLFY